MLTAMEERKVKDFRIEIGYAFHGAKQNAVELSVDKMPPVTQNIH